MKEAGGYDGYKKIEFRFPQYPMAESFNRFLCLSGKATKESRLGKNLIKPLGLRVSRAKSFKEYLFTENRDTEKEIIRKSTQEKKLYKDYLTKQEDIIVDLGENGGEIRAKFVILNPNVKETIVLIPGISNDLESMGALPMEMALETGKRIITLGYPDAWKSEMTKKFYDAVKNADDYKPYTDFFKAAINKICKEESDIELWGFSTGSVMIAEILKDENFQKRTENAVLLSPPNCTDQKHLKINLFREYIEWFKNLNNFGKMNPSNRETILKTKEYRKLMLDTHLILRKRVLEKHEWWKKNIKVKEGGKIVMVSGKKDFITNSRKTVNEIQKTGIEVIEIDNGIHNLPLMEPSKIIGEVNKSLK